MSFRIRENKHKKPVYVQTESKEEVLDKEGKPVLDKEGKPTYKMINVSSGAATAEVKSNMSNKLGHSVSSSLQIRTSDPNCSCDYF